MHFGRAGERARRKRGFEHVHAGHVIQERAFNIAHNVHDMAVALHTESLRHPHRAGLGNAPDVVAGQVNQHHMLGALLGVVEQLHLGGPVQLGAGTPRPGASQRTNGDFLRRLAIQRDLFLAHQNLGRGAHHMEVAKVVVIHIRAGIERAKGPVKTQR